jgi:hypothetical protein
VKRKKEFDCVCGHKEDHHNFDPNSYFFGCCEKFIAIGNVLSTQCKCNEFRPDNLGYIEKFL